MRPHRILVASLFGLLCSAPSPVRAADPARTEILAKAQMTQGLRLYDEGRYPEAEAAFLRAYALSPRPALMRNVADAREARGELAGAIDALEIVLASARPGEQLQLSLRISALSAVLAQGAGAGGGAGGGDGIAAGASSPSTDVLLAGPGK